MKIPKSFKVKGNTWTVEYKWSLTLDGKPVLGYCDPDLHVLYIDRLATKEDKWNTFIHEYTHAILKEYYLYQEGGLDGFAEEVVCSAIAEEFSKNFTLKFKGNKDE